MFSFATQEKHHRKIPVVENYTLTNLYPNTLYYVWLAARSQRGEGATTIPLPVRTKQYGKQKKTERCAEGRDSFLSSRLSHLHLRGGYRNVARLAHLGYKQVGRRAFRMEAQRVNFAIYEAKLFC